MHKTIDRLTTDVAVTGTSEVTVLSGPVSYSQPAMGYIKLAAAGHTYRTSSTSSSLTFRLRFTTGSSSFVVASFVSPSTSTASGISFTLDAWMQNAGVYTGDIALAGGLSVHTGLTTGVAGDGYIQRFSNGASPVVVDTTDGGPREGTVSLTVQASNSNFQATFRGGVIEHILDDA